jgi:hypothetical protein
MHSFCHSDIKPWSSQPYLVSADIPVATPALRDVECSVSDAVVVPPASRRFRLSIEIFISVFSLMYLSLRERYLSSNKRFSQRSFSNTLQQTYKVLVR